MSDSPTSEEQVAEVEETEVETPAEGDEPDVDESEAETPAEGEQPEDEPEAAARTAHAHYVTPAYVEMIVSKRHERGDMTAKQLKEYRLQLLQKHGLPATAKELRAWEKQQAEVKAARKAEAKEQRRAARVARKAELATAAVES